MESNIVMTGFPEIVELRDLHIGEYFIQRGEDNTGKVFVVTENPDGHDHLVYYTCVNTGDFRSMHGECLVVPVTLDITVAPIIREDICVTLGKS